MKHLQQFEIPAKSEFRVTRVTCDLCGAEIKPKRHEINKAVVEYEEGDIYPEGGSATRYSVDICGDCFRDRLIPWLEEQGAKVEIEEYVI